MPKWMHCLFIHQRSTEDSEQIISGILNEGIKRHVNSKDPGKCGNNFESTIFKIIIQNNSSASLFEVAPRHMPRNLTDEKSTLVQVMAWYRKGTSHYQGQCGPRSMLPYSFTRPQCVNQLRVPCVATPVIGHRFLCPTNLVSIRWFTTMHINVQIFLYQDNTILNCFLSCITVFAWTFSNGKNDLSDAIWQWHCI